MSCNEDDDGLRHARIFASALLPIRRTAKGQMPASLHGYKIRQMLPVLRYTISEKCSLNAEVRAVTATFIASTTAIYAL
jgi:hypothetical protein